VWAAGCTTTTTTTAAAAAAVETNFVLTPSDAYFFVFTQVVTTVDIPTTLRGNRSKYEHHHVEV